MSAVDDARALYEQYGQRIFAFCLSRLRSREEAEDAAQTTFMYALRGLQRGIEPRSALAWLFKIAENVCHSRHRAASRRLRHEADRADVERLPTAMRAADELIGLSDALAAMPERQRRAILLREWRGLSYQEIGQELGLSQSAVETLLFRARRTLASRLRALDLGSALAFLRGLLSEGAGKAVATVAALSVGATLAVVPVVEHVRPGSGRPAHEGPLVTEPVGTTPTAAGTAAVSGTSGVTGQADPDQNRARTAREAPRRGVAATPQTPTARPDAGPSGTGSATPTPSGGTEGGTTAPTAAPPSAGVDAGATTPAVSANATASTSNGTVTTSADVGVQTPDGSTSASASADVDSGGVTAGVDVTTGSQSAGTQVTVPPPPPPPTLP